MSDEFYKTAVVTYFGKSVQVACDRQCCKAFGRQLRPRLRLSDDTIIFYGDDNLGHAPHVTGLLEGASDKPQFSSEFPTIWCVRACERCSMSAYGADDPPAVKTFPSIAQLITKDAGKERHVSAELEARERALLTAVLPIETVTAVYPLIKNLSPQQAGMVRLWAIGRAIDLSGKSQNHYTDPMPTWLMALIQLSKEGDHADKNTAPLPPWLMDLVQPSKEGDHADQNPLND